MLGFSWSSVNHHSSIKNGRIPKDQRFPSLTGNNILSWSKGKWQVPKVAIQNINNYTPTRTSCWTMHTLICPFSIIVHVWMLMNKIASLAKRENEVLVWRCDVGRCDWSQSCQSLGSGQQCWLLYWSSSPPALHSAQTSSPKQLYCCPILEGKCKRWGCEQ